MEFSPFFEFDDKQISLLNLIRIFKEDIMIIYNAILEERRVLFVGFQQPVSNVCHHVISSLFLFGGFPLNEMVKRRYFPYTPLSCMFTELKTPGYVAGAANLMYKNRSEVWDYLCDLDQGKVIKNQKIKSEAQYNEIDQEFISKLLVMIDELLNDGNTEYYVENLLRSYFRDFTLNLSKICTDEASFKNKEQQKYEMICNAERLMNWKETNSFQFYQAQRKEDIKNKKVKTIDFEVSIDRLRVGQNLSEEYIISQLQNFLKYAIEDDQVLELVSYLPESQGGLYPISIFLFHKSEMIKLLVVSLLQRIDKTKLGRELISKLNTFVIMTYDRISKEILK